MKKVIKVTHIDNCGHGYLSVSKKDIILIGLDINLISGYSGMDFNRVYLEEDSDCSIFLNKAKESGFEVIVKSGYNPSFSITHNYSPSLFNFVGDYGQKIIMYDNLEYTVIGTHPIVKVQNNRGQVYRLLKTNPLKHIKSGL